jgi:YHS domain-containing protein
MQVTCKGCGSKIERETAYRHIHNGKNEYYCNENEFCKLKIEKENRINTLNLVNKVFGYIVINTAIHKELSEIAKIHSYTKIMNYIQDNIDKLQQSMNKDFNSEYGKIRYFSTIIKNNIIDYQMPKPTIDKIINEEITNIKYTPKPRKKSINEYLTEME